MWARKVAGPEEARFCKPFQSLPGQSFGGWALNGLPNRATFAEEKLEDRPGNTDVIRAFGHPFSILARKDNSLPPLIQLPDNTGSAVVYQENFEADGEF